ncbi:hypothetical protein ACHAXT_007954 [Thalassiosira profunda]
MASSAPPTVTLALAPGRLGITIDVSATGTCLVTGRPNLSSPLQVHDEILSLNGILLADVQVPEGQVGGKVGTWVKLFAAFDGVERKVVVHRGNGSGAAPASGASKAGHVHRAAAAAKPEPQKMEVICLDDSDDDDAAPAAAAAKPAAGKKKPAFRDSNAGQKRKAPAKKPAAAKPAKGAKKAPKKAAGSKKGEFVHDDNYMKLLTEGFNNYGSVSPCETYYIANNNDSYGLIADKVGLDDWKELNNVPFNKRFYGKLSARVLLKKGTIVKIPRELCSKWKMGKLVDNHIHVSCAGLTEVPTTDFLCEACLDVLAARKKAHSARGVPKDAEGRRSLEAKLPALPKLNQATVKLAQTAQAAFVVEMTARKDAALRRLKENQRVLAESSRQRVSDLTNEVNAQNGTVYAERANHSNAKSAVFSRHGIRSWSVKNQGRSYIKFRRADGTTGEVERIRQWSYPNGMRTRSQSPEWSTYYARVQACSRELESLPEKAVHEAAKQRLASLKEDLAQARDEENERPSLDRQDEQGLLLRFAQLLSEPKLEFEKEKAYQNRGGCAPSFLGVVKVEDADIRTLNILKEPTELVLAIPASSSAIAIDVEPIESGEEYYLFGTAELFSRTRNDDTPMDFSPTSTRTAQRDLMAMLLRDPRNAALQVTKPQIPSSVSLRGTTDETLGDVVKCFDLSELVRDCHYPIQNQPMANTPKRLADNGLVLRNYQKTSLQWLLDKEQNPTGMGSSGELWSRMRCLGGSEEFFYCELTGSICNDIFDYNVDVDQKDASKLCGSTFPSSAIIGSEMGLGKTVIALSLVVASPPTLPNRVLPREHLAQIDHPAYVPPPSAVACTSSTNKHAFVSNATLVIAPMTLCPQWQGEIQRFAPWMSFATLHNEETDSAAEIASKDIVVVSTFMMSQPNGRAGAILRKLRQIHFHRIFLDESHYNNTGERVKLSLAQLSATHRYCVTGTPVGHSLTDLHGQLRFLRIPQFCRPSFWESNIGKPYSEHNVAALNVLRSLLSRMVIRHSKEQTLQGGEALVSLPPRTVETLLLPFGSEAEKKIYEYIDLRNTQRFMELRSDSPSTVLGQFLQLQGLIHHARHACGHPSLVNLDNLHSLNEKLEYERRNRLGKSKPEQKKTKKKSATRADVLQEAIAKARPSAQGRMREAVLHREPTGKCPECRETMVKSEVTFLGDATDAGLNDAPNPSEEDTKPKAKESTEVDRQQRSYCHTLPPEFLTAANTGFNIIGTKIARLLEELKSMIQKDPTAKAVVFSQFLGTLNVAGQEMTARGIQHTRVDGMMKQHQRADAIMSFTNDPNTRVLLLSMRAGAAGLNLMAANHCFLMDPAMNSAVEEQAIDRIHRIGHTRPVFVKRLVIKGSVEERILENRRSLAADRPTASTQLDGAAMLEDDEQDMKQSAKRGRHEDENDLGEQRFQRLRQLEALFGCSATVKVTKA